MVSLILHLKRNSYTYRLVLKNVYTIVYRERGYINLSSPWFNVHDAQMLGVEFVNRYPGSVELKMAGRGLQQYGLMVTIPFDSTRKRMSVIVQAPDGSYILYCKVGLLFYSRVASVEWLTHCSKCNL